MERDAYQGLDVQEEHADNPVTGLIHLEEVVHRILLLVSYQLCVI